MMKKNRVTEPRTKLKILSCCNFDRNYGGKSCFKLQTKRTSALSCNYSEKPEVVGSRISSTPTANNDRIKGLIEALFGIVLILGVGAAILFYRHELEALAGFGYAGIFVIALLSAATIFIPAPGLAIAASSAIALNPLLVGIIGGTGAAFGELTGYFVGKGIADIRHKTLLDQYKKWIEKYDVYAIIVIAAIPNPLFDIASIAAGLLKIPWQRFFLAALIGNIIKYTAISVLFALFGSTLLSYVKMLS